MRFVFFILLAILFNLNKISAQTLNFKNKFEDADYYFLFEEFGKSLKIYNELYQQNSENANLNYLIGLCYIQSVKDKDKIKSIPFLEFASKNINTKYNEGKYKETKAPIYSLFYLAFAYRLNKEFDKAIEAYKKYMTFLNTENKIEHDNALKEIEACEYAKQLIQVPINLESIKTNQFADTMSRNKSNIATSDSTDLSFLKATTSESCPIVASDGSYMVFSMGENNVFPQEVQSLNFDFERYKTDDIYYTAKKSDGQWDTPVNVMAQIKPKFQIVPVCLSPDGKKLYLVQDDNDDGNIYESKFANGQWSPVEKVKGDINTRQWETHASFSPDGTTLYFTSARKGGIGGLDIYKSHLQNNGEWGKAENLGSVINTKEDEETPTILPDGKTLFFSSRGHKVIGGFDIFLSTLDNNGKWSEPMNVGYSINTINSDFAYINKIDNQLAYSPLTRSDLREEYSGKEDKNNSYKLTLNPEKPSKPIFNIKGTVVFKSGNVKYPEHFSIAVVDSVKKDSLKNITIDEISGNYSFSASNGTFLMNFKAEGYKDFTKHIFLPDIYTPTTLTVNVELVPFSSPSDVVAQSDIIYDYEKNIKNLNAKRNVDLASGKIRYDSLKLLAEINYRNKKEQNINNENLFKDDTIQKNKTNLLAENKNSENKKNSSNNNIESTDVLTQGSNIVNNVLFNFDCINPTDFKENLNKLAAYLVGNKNCKIKIDGHSDDLGNEFNKKIVSEMRAVFIKKYLVEQGALKGNISIEGYSSNKLIASEDFPETRKYNRRAEFKIVENCKGLIINPIVVPDFAKFNQKSNVDLNSNNSVSSSAVKIKNVLFKFDYLNNKEIDVINILADFLKKNSSCEIEIVGHSDAQGESSYKKFVSEMRAKNIKEKLVEKGADSKNITVRGESDSNQIANDNTPESRVYNRRVEFHVIKDGTQKLIVEPIVVPEYYKIK